ncbi:MAG TPA: O-antigen ligase family protein [Solirubrobacteraceae bacterium]|jgi:O-antigen ligase|nr:O-antigen ligase family protein [Solirubrobacteraceae bacterium]
MAARQLPLLSPPVVALLAAGAALFSGLLIAVRPALGVGFVAALAFVPIAFMNLRLALVLWTPIPFIQYLPAVAVGPTFASLVVLAAWLGSARDRRVAGTTGLARRAPLVIALVALVVWATCSIALAEDYGRALAEASNLYVAALVFAIFATTLRTERDVRLVVAAFVFGAVLSVSIGLAATGLHPVDSAIETATHTEGRLKGGSSDPNYLAAGIVPAIVLAAGLAATTRSALWRWAIGVAVFLLAVGLAATQSRGGFLALLAAMAAALVLVRRHRLQILAGVALLAGLVALMLATTPGAWDRVTRMDGGGNGRSDLWTVAWRVGQEHPVTGVGISDFAVEAHRYVRRPGQLTEAAQIVDRPHVAHNTYLQVLTELGLVGLALFAALVISFLAITYRAARDLAARGQPALASLGSALFVAQLAWLVALFFISAGGDQRLWVLLALGVVLRGIAARAPDPVPAAAR